MTSIEYKKYKQVLQQIFDHFGGGLGLARFLNTHYTNVYTWASDNNLVDGHIKRKIPLHHVHKIIKKIPSLTLEDIRPDIFKNT